MKRVRPTVEPQLELGVDYVRTVEQLSMRGLTYAQVLSLGFPDRDDLRQAAERGQSQGALNIATVLYQRALSGDLRAMELYLKARGGSHWTSPLLDAAGAQPITLAMLRERFSREIEERDGQDDD